MADDAGQKALLDQYLKDIRIRLIGLVGTRFLRAVRASLTLKIADPNGLLKEAEQTPLIAAFWHSQQLMMPWLYKKTAAKAKGRAVYVLSSRSADGRLMANALKRLGLKSVLGSSSKGGTEALLKLNRVLAEGSHVVITPDGPRGPALKVKCGAINLAITSGKAILPCGLAASKSWAFSSWDKMILPKPFSKVVIYVGQKILVPQDLPEAELGKWQEKLELALNKATEEAGKLLS